VGSKRVLSGMKRFLLILLCLIVIAGGAGIYLFRAVSTSGSSPIEAWIAGQLEAIADDYLNPRLSFSDLDYTYPGTISLRNLRLTADDPANPGKTIDILGADSAVLTLAEVPQVGKPIVIERIELNQPLVSVVAVKPGSGEFVGFSHLVKKHTVPAQASTTAPSTSAPARRNRLSDFLRMRLVQIQNGKILYDPRIAGTEPMTLDQINTTLKLAPDKDAGWHMLSLAVARDPLFDMSTAGQINLDTFDVRDFAFKIKADVQQDKLDYLPPQMQKVLRQYDVRGSLYMLVIGEFPLMHPQNGSADVEIRLSGANVTLDQYRIPVDELSVNANFEDNLLTLNMLRIAALGGVATVTGTAETIDAIDSDLKFEIKDMMLQELLAKRETGRPPTIAGKLNASAEIAAPLLVIAAKATPPSTQPASYMRFASQNLPEKWGSLKLDLAEGRLTGAPGFASLISAFRAAARLVDVKINDQARPSERAKVAAELAGDKAQISEITFIGDYLAGRGKGTITLDRKLDLLINAGPIEKVQSMLGVVGGAIAKVTDKLLAYRVSGTLQAPKVEVQVGGNAVTGVAKKTGSAVESGAKAVESGAKAVGEGVNKIGEGIGNLLRGGKN
jgi:hypothetical protein